MDGRALPALASSLAILALVGAAIPFTKGYISAHMLLHIALMNVFAPLTAVAAFHIRPLSDRAGLFWAATIAQSVLLWLWHAPPAYHAAVETTIASLAMHGSMFAAALAFWLSLTALSERDSWQAVFSLLVTGKLACLLGVLLTFAPRPLYEVGHIHNHAAQSLLSDQQLAGLYMVAACPLSFVLAGLIIATQAIHRLSRTTVSAE